MQSFFKNYIPNRALGILVGTNSLVVIAASMLAPIYAMYIERIGGNLLEAGITGGIYFLAAGVTTLIAGRYADIIKENELILVWGYILTGVGFMLYMWIGSILALLAVQVLIGFADALLSPAFDAIYSKHLDGGREGREWSFYGGVTYFSTAAGAMIGGFIAMEFGFEILFTIMAVLCWVSAIYIYFIPRDVL